MVDFIHEVEEELRKDKYNALLRKFGPYLVALVIAIVVIAGVVEYRKSAASKTARAASASFVQATKLAESGDSQEAISQYLEIAKVAPKGYAGRSLDMAAALELEAGNKERAIELYDKAAETYSEPVHKELSSYKAALIVMDMGRYDETISRTSALDYKGGPYQDLAKELNAMAKLQTGDQDSAKTQFGVLINMPGVQNGVKARAGQSLALIKAGDLPSEPSTQETDDSKEIDTPAELSGTVSAEDPSMPDTQDAPEQESKKE